MTDDGRRVKLYILNANNRQWDEHGTGHVFSYCFEEIKLTLLSVKAEGDDAFLLECPVLPDKKYRREGRNTVIWFEADCIYIALHFQEEAGCNEIWEKICQVLGKDLSLEIPQDIMENSKNEKFDDVSDISALRLEAIVTFHYMERFITLLKTCMTSPMRREKLLRILKNVDKYFRSLEIIFRFRIEMMRDTVTIHTNVRNLILIRSHLVLISTLHKNANTTSQVESRLQKLNL